MLQWFAIVVLSVLACVTYGIIHDQITARICIEYFTIGHPQIIPSTDPTILGIAWGIAATWWVGVLLGIPLATVARVGTRPPKSARALLRPIAILFAGTAVLALLAGISGYYAASKGWVFLLKPLADNVPTEKHIYFIADLWSHAASYLGGCGGGLLLMVWVWRSRSRAELTTTSL